MRYYLRVEFVVEATDEKAAHQAYLDADFERVLPGLVNTELVFIEDVEEDAATEGGGQ